jgi:hypothetical protein
MIPKSGSRFSDKIVRKNKSAAGSAYFTTSTGQGASRTRRSAVPPMMRS